jgi:dTDP-4-amino-4,6-dideoxygalactose transaminase
MIMINDREFIPFHRPSIGDEEIAEVIDTLRSGWLTTGPKTARFEREFSNYVHSPFALAVNSCTAGLHLALAALGIGSGDEVITTPLTFCATVNTILHVGATPVLADIGPNGNIDPNSIEARITPRTKAIIPVHLGGLPCDLASIWQIAKKWGLRVIEDAAHAAGTLYDEKPIGAATQTLGTCSDAVAFSFYATKNLTTAEGGMVTTPDRDLYERMKLLCLHGIHQLHKLERSIEIRARYARLYSTILADVEEVELPHEAPPGDRHAWHLYSIRLNLEKLSIDRGQFIEALSERRIGTSVHFIPIPLHPFFRPFAKLPHNQCPAALELYPRLVTLPLYPEMTEAEVEYVGRTVRELLLQARRRLATSKPICVDQSLRLLTDVL